MSLSVFSLHLFLGPWANTKKSPHISSILCWKWNEVVALIVLDRYEHGSIFVRNMELWN